MIVAESVEIARKAVKKVKVVYKNIRKPIVTLREAIKDPERLTDKVMLGDPLSIGDIDPFDKEAGNIIPYYYSTCN